MHTLADTKPRCDGLLLAIETAGSRCSATVVRQQQVLAAESRPLRHGHAEALLPMIERVMTAAGRRPAELAAVAAATGPGGFTGIRAGLAAIRGIAMATGAQPIGVSSFAAVAAAMTWDSVGERRLLVALDSRRDDLYLQLFAADHATPLAAPTSLLPDRVAAYVEAAIDTGELLIAGDAADAAAAALRGRLNVMIAADTVPDATGVAMAAYRQLRRGVPEPARPLYLRPPDVTIPAAR